MCEAAQQAGCLDLVLQVKSLPIRMLCLAAFAVAHPSAMAQSPAGQSVTADDGSAASGSDLSFGYMTAAKLAEQCAAQSGFAMTYCFAYLAGVRDTTRAYEVWLGQAEFCAPGTVTQIELRDVFNAFLAANPEYRSGQGASVTLAAFKSAYPCDGSAGQSTVPGSRSGSP